MVATRSLSRAALLVVCALAITSCASMPGLYKIGGKGEVRYTKASWCVPWSLKRVLRRVAHKYGDVTVFSTWRSPWHNRKVGGAAKSYHKTCRAVDFKVDGDMAAVYRYVGKQRAVGGRHRYRSGHIHIDTGPKRTW